MKLYLVGMEYDDFSEGGFDVMAVCDSQERAESFILANFFNTINTLSIKECELNIFYKDGIHYEED